MLNPTLGLIYAESNTWTSRKILSNRLAVWFGLISFPLYLWHWPILSFIRIIESKTPSWSIRVCAVFCSVLLAWLTYKFIECPIRFGRNSNIKIALLFIPMLFIGYAGYQIHNKDGFELRFSKSGNDSTIDKEKLYAQAVTNCKQLFPQWHFDDNPCLLQKKRNNPIAIVGDSHAGQLFQASQNILLVHRV